MGTAARPCGSRFNGATAFRRWRSGWNSRMMSATTALQWGHRLSAMEIPPFAASPCRYRSFNGAIAFRRWRSESWLGGVPPFRALQWGHRLSAMEMELLVYALGLVEVASMGPSPFGDGDIRFNTKSFETTSKLQWGHRLSAMEIRTPLVYVAIGVFHASMRPSPFGDGDNEEPALHVLFDAASMGPSPFGDGDHYKGRDYFVMLGRLQWGHRLSAMEMEDHGCFCTCSCELQWGHRLSAMEIAWRGAARALKGGLQWGHRLSAMEMASSGTRSRRE